VGRWLGRRLVGRWVQRGGASPHRPRRKAANAEDSTADLRTRGPPYPGRTRFPAPDDVSPGVRVAGVCPWPPRPQRRGPRPPAPGRPRIVATTHAPDFRARLRALRTDQGDEALVPPALDDPAACSTAARPAAVVLDVPFRQEAAPLAVPVPQRLDGWEGEGRSRPAGRRWRQPARPAARPTTGGGPSGPFPDSAAHRVCISFVYSL
jgi:hypothetical protein